MQSRMTLFVLLFSPVVARAQETALPQFHHGQWALEFRGISGLMGFGIMRFSSPRTAWIMNLGANAQILNGNATSGGTSTDAKNHNVTLQAAIGKRFYQPIRSKIRAFQSIGFAGGYQDFNQTSVLGTFQTKSWYGGLAGQLGGAYWLTSNISLGGTATASAVYMNQDITNGAAQITEHGFGITAVDVALVLGIYF